MRTFGEHLHVLLIALVDLTALENLQRYRTILVIGKERTATGLTHVLHNTADAHRTVQFLTQVDDELSIFQFLDVVLPTAEVTLYETDDLL